MKYLVKINLVFLFALLLCSEAAMGQNHQVDHKVNISIPEVALLGIVSEEPGNSETINAAPNEAGSLVYLRDVRLNKGIWINYSSINRNPEHRRKVTATVQGEIPPGLRLAVEAEEATGDGRGMLGQPAGKIYLSETPAEVISGIGSCYTGKGANHGHLLSYHLEADNAGRKLTNITDSETTLHVIYTLTDHN